MANAKTKQTSGTLEVLEFDVGRVDFCLLGKTPFICNSMSNKTRQELLMPKGKKSAAEKARSLKHNPREEFRNSPYLNPDKAAETYIEHLSTCFKQAIRCAGLDIPGATKSQLGRLLWIEGERVPIYGLPRLFMSVTRSADMNRTPDVRTRAILPAWGCKLTVSFVQPLLNVKVVGNLLAAAGLTQGMGDWRPQKGSGNYGQFILVDEKDKEYQKLLKQGWQDQFKAMQNPVPYDAETEKLLSWFDDEADRRGMKVAGGIES